MKDTKSNYQNINGWALLSEEEDRMMLNYANQYSLRSHPTAWHDGLVTDIVKLYLSPDCKKISAIDVGASYGWMTVPLCNAFNYVHAFEIIPSVRDCLRTNTKQLPNLTIHECGLSSSSHVAHFDIKPISGHSRVCHSSDSNSSLLVRRLDDFSFNHVDLIKIDVEGHELDVLLGAEQTLVYNSPLLVVECDYVNRYRQSLIERQKIITYLLSLGYYLIDVRGRDFIFTKNDTNVRSYLNKFTEGVV